MNFNHPYFRKGVSLVVGLLLVFAGWIKLIHISGIEAILSHYSWVPESMTGILGFSLGAFEFLLGVWLISGHLFMWARQVAIVTFGIFLLVLVLQFVGMAFGWGQVLVECPCYGAVFSPNPTFMIVQDCVILFALYTVGPKPLKAMSWKGVLPLILLLAGLLRLGYMPEFDYFVVKARPGFQMDNLPSIHDQAPNQRESRLVVVVKEPLARLKMQELAIAFPSYRPVLIHADGPALETGPEWTSMEGNKRLMPLMFRSYPTVFLVEEDRISAIWYGKSPVGD